MRQAVLIIGILCGIIFTVEAQRPRGGGGNDRGGFSLSNLNKSNDEIPDSLLLGDSIKGRPLTGYRLSPLLGEPYVAPLDTNILNFPNSTYPEGQSLALAYLANIGSPAQSRLFHERKESRDFIFADPFNYYITTPENAYFYDTKIPYTNVLYTFNGGSRKKEERLKGVLTVNFGKKINIGGEIDYIYGRGHYNSNGNKLLSYRFFGNYLTDRYELRAYLSNFNFVTHENGGLTNDRYVTHPDDFRENKRTTPTENYPVRYSGAFNRVRGKQYYLTHRYNLGFYRTLDTTDVFVPVSSIIHTLHYEDNRRHFTSTNMAGIDSCYTDIYEMADSVLHDRPSTWRLNNTVGLSLREGFQDWVKFGLTAYIRMEKRQFKLAAVDPDGVTHAEYLTDPENLKHKIIQGKHDVYDEFSTYIGAEMSKRQGSILTYNAQGELAIVGDDLGEFRLTGNLESRFPLLGKEAIIRAEGHIKNLTPAFFARHNHSRYFIWDNSFSNERHVFAGATIDLESTRTRLFGGVTNVKNYIYYNSLGYPEQFTGNVQVVHLGAKQDFRFRGFGWENEAVYQLSSEKGVLPLPQVSLHSNMYVTFKLVKVLTVQLGADVHYFTSYYAPYYEPATQQFQLQDPENRVKVGNFPLINAYANFHLKQARFFIGAYNLGTMFTEPNHFSLPHYPLNPYLLKFGIAVKFNN